VTTFLRWGIFGILGVAALLYAYNASKRLAEAHAAKAAPAASAPAADDVDEPEEPVPSESQQPEPVSAPQMPAAPARALTPECAAELQVARRAIDMRKEGAPLDRVLRIQEIAWQESPERRERLVAVATRWYNYSGDFSPETLRMAVVNACEPATPVS
jgi:hypothetical protein